MAAKQQKVYENKGYKGNIFLRAIKDRITLTDDNIEELKKCKASFEYFITTYMKIISLDKGEIDFALYKFQRKFLRTIHRNRKVISMQPRQSGKTQTVVGYLLWFTLFNSTKNIAIVANKLTAAREIMERFQFAYERLPTWMQTPVKTWNKGSLELYNGSKVFTAATTKSGIRGKSVDILYIDESAFIENNVANDFFAAIAPTLSSGKSTKLIVTSTPKGFNHFQTMWNEAEKGTNGMVPLRIYYHEHPDRDEAWAVDQRKTLGAIRFNAEVGCEFIGSSSTLLSGDTLSRLNKAVGIPIYQDDTGNLVIFEEPNQGTKNAETKEWKLPPHSYFAVVDVSRGVGGDASTCLVIDTTELPYRLVARYMSNEVSPLLFPSIINKLAIEYNHAFVLIEINDNGQQIADILHDELEYDNILTVVKNGTRGQALSNGFGRVDSTQMGVRTTKQVKSIGCGSIKTLIEESNLIIEDDATIKEFATFIETRGSYAADDGYHDDCVMPLVLFGWVTTQTYFKDLTNLSVRERIFQARIENIQQRFTPFMFKSDGREEEQTKSESNGLYVSSLDHSMSLNSSYERFNQLSSEEMEDLKWLLG